MQKIVFSSSVLSPLMKDYLSAIERFCHDRYIQVDIIQLNDTSTIIKKKLKKSDCYVCILSHSYGYQPYGSDSPSLIEIEYELATELNIPVIPLLIDPEAHWDDRFRLREREKDYFFNLVNKIARQVREPLIYKQPSDVINNLSVSLRRLSKFIPQTINLKQQKDLTEEFVFISYKRQDWESFAQKVADRLIAENIKIWIDRYSIEIGDWWKQEIDLALEHCTYLILCVTPEALQSPYVQMEYQYFLSSKKKIYPIMCRETPLPSELSHIQYVNFSHLDKIINTIKNKIT